MFNKFSIIKQCAVCMLVAFLAACGDDVDSTSASNTSTNSVNTNSTDASSSSSSPSPAPTTSSMSAAAIQGRQLYDSTRQGCLSCHGADGQSPTFKPIDLSAENYQHSSVSGESYTLERYIELWMPVSNPSMCVGTCASNIAEYIRSMDESNSSTTSTTEVAVVDVVADATTSTNLVGFAPLNVNFNGSNSIGEIVSYQWDFGNGAEASGREQQYQYTQAGNYEASLTVTGEDGSVDTTSIMVVVQQNTAPTARIAASAVTGIAPLAVDFNASQSFDDQGIVDYQWSIDGNNYNGVTQQYEFTEPGGYDVELRVVDSSGLEAIATQTVTVAAPNVNIPPVADASRSSNLSGSSPLTVNFNASASSDDRNEIVSYSWNFGGGVQFDGVNVSRVFESAGDYNVSLTVTDAGGLSHTIQLRVRVDDSNQAPEAVIAAQGSTTGLAPYNLQLSSAASTDDSAVTQRAWDVNEDGSIESSLTNPTFSFSDPGNYRIRLTVSDAQNLSDTDSVSVQVLDPFNFAQQRYQENCSSCHGVNGQGGAGSIPALTRSWSLSELEPDVLRMVNLHGDCQSVDRASCVNALSNYIMEEFTATVPQPPVNVGSYLISVPVKALSQTEFFNTIESVFSITFSDAERANFNLPLDSRASRYATDSDMRVLRGLSADPSVLDDLYPALTAIYDELMDQLTDSHFQNNYSAQAGCAFSQIANSENCRRGYRSAILSRAFRRTISGDDYALANATNAYDVFTSNGQNPRDAFINSIVSYTLFSPAFIFHSYRGDQENGEGYQLTNEELAHKVAYLVWGAPADSAMLSQDWMALLSGQADAQLDNELLRLFSDARSSYFINTFMSQWLQLETDVAKELIESGENRAEEFAEAIKGESEHFMRYLITQNESINSIINADFTFMNNALADYYGVNVSGLGNEFARVDFTGNTALSNRQGLLTQANFLTTGTKSDRPGTVHRGVTILKDVMCHIIGPPSGETPDISGVDRTQHTESALFRMVTETPGSSCVGCHRNINPMSFPFEAFDRFGRHPLSLSNGGSLPEYAVYESIGVDNNPNANGPVEKSTTFLLDQRGGNISFTTDHGRSISGSFSDHRGLISVLDQTPAFSECINDNFYDFIIGTNAERGASPSSVDHEIQHASQTASKQAALNGVTGIRNLIANLLKRPEFSVIRRN